MTPEQQAAKIIHAYSLDLGPGRYEKFVYEISEAIKAAQARGVVIGRKEATASAGPTHTRKIPTAEECMARAKKALAEAKEREKATKRLRAQRKEKSARCGRQEG